MEDNVSIIFLLVAVSGMFIQNDGCPQECLCSETQADCYSRHLQQIPDNISESVINVYLHDNNISDIDANKLSHLHKLETLSLQMNHLTRLKSQTFANMEQLKKLNIGNNAIETIEDNVFTQLPKLQDLDMAYNKITDITGKFNISSLQRLFLGCNQLTSLQANSLNGVRNLYYLNVANNAITLISQSAFMNMIHLSKLVLRGNPLKNADRIFGDLGTMSYLDISSCHLMNIPQNLPWALRNLNISDNNLTTIHSQDLHSTRYLAVIILDNNQIESIQDLALLYTPYLTHFYINNNKLRVLPQIPKNIETFSADNNQIQQLYQLNFAHDSAMKLLSLSRNKIHRISAYTFAHLINLNMLLLDHNDIQEVKNMTFAGLRQLTTLNLEFNPIKLIESRAFGGLQKLKELQLANVYTSETIIEGLIFQDIPSLSNLNLQGSSSIIHDISNSPDLLRTLRNIQYLNLMNGSLSTLSMDIRISLPNLESLKLSDNPWQCDASLVQLYNWINDSPKLFANSTIICALPDYLRGRLIQDVSMEELILTTTAMTTNNITNNNQNTTADYNKDVKISDSTDSHLRDKTLLPQISTTPSLTEVKVTQQLTVVHADYEITSRQNLIPSTIVPQPSAQVPPSTAIPQLMSTFVASTPPYSTAATKMTANPWIQKSNSEETHAIASVYATSTAIMNDEAESSMELTSTKISQPASNIITTTSPTDVSSTVKSPPTALSDILHTQTILLYNTDIMTQPKSTRLDSSSTTSTQSVYNAATNFNTSSTSGDNRTTIKQSEITSTFSPVIASTASKLLSSTIKNIPGESSIKLLSSTIKNIPGESSIKLLSSTIKNIPGESSIKLLSSTIKNIPGESSIDFQASDRIPPNEIATTTEANNHSATTTENSREQESSQIQQDVQTALNSNADPEQNKSYPAKSSEKTVNRLPIVSSSANMKLRAIIITVSASLFALVIGLFILILTARYCKRRKIVFLTDKSQNSTEFDTETSDTVFIISHMASEHAEKQITDTHRDGAPTFTTKNSELEHESKQIKKGFKFNMKSIISKTNVDCMRRHGEDDSELLVYS